MKMIHSLEYKTVLFQFLFILLSPKKCYKNKSRLFGIVRFLNCQVDTHIDACILFLIVLLSYLSLTQNHSLIWQNKNVWILNQSGFCSKSVKYFQNWWKSRNLYIWAQFELSFLWVWLPFCIWFWFIWAKFWTTFFRGTYSGKIFQFQFAVLNDSHSFLRYSIWNG